jgi:hypothetical protein
MATMPQEPAQAPDALTLTHPAAGSHLIVPWAVSLGDDCQQALAAFDDAKAFPNLQRLLQALPQAQWLRGDEYDPTPPHERVLAQCMGWPQGQAPWAAIQAQADGLNPQAGQAWGLITPCHWLMGHDHLTLIHPDELRLGESESRAVFEAIAPLFEEEGWALHWGHPTRWYAVHPSLADLPTASLDRLLGRNPDLWMPEHPQARLIKRLQAETQMLLYQHPVNEGREARGQLTVNSFWISGNGSVPVDVTRLAQRPAGLQLADAPRQALLKGDLPGWQQAWQALEAGPLQALAQMAEAGQAVQLTLCGERHAVTLSSAAPQGWLGRTLGKLKQGLQGADASQPSKLLQQL